MAVIIVEWMWEAGIEKYLIKEIFDSTFKKVLRFSDKNIKHKIVITKNKKISSLWFKLFCKFYLNC